MRSKFPENENFLEQKANNEKTKVCPICGERHIIESNKLGDAIKGFFVTMTCPKEQVKFGGRTVNVSTFTFLIKHKLQ